MKQAEKRLRLVGAGVAWSMGGDACVAPVLFPYRLMPATMGDAAFIIPRMRLRPLPTPHLFRPYECDDLPQKTCC